MPQRGLVPPHRLSVTSNPETVQRRRARPAPTLRAGEEKGLRNPCRAPTAIARPWRRSKKGCSNEEDYPVLVVR